MALLRSDIINKEFILQAVRVLEKTNYVEIDSITTGTHVDREFQDVIKIQIRAVVRRKLKEYNWIAKLAPGCEKVGTAAHTLGVWEKEVRVYRDLFSYFEYVGRTNDVMLPMIPSLIYSKLELSKECMLFSDENELGLTPSTFPLDRPSLLLAVEWLAKFHAIGYSFYKSGHPTEWLIDPLPFAGKSCPDLLKIIRSADSTDTAVMSEYASRLESLFSSSAYADICRSVFSPRDGLFVTVCHGRPTVRNLLVWQEDQEDQEEKGSQRPLEALFANFEEARLCQPGTDLAILLYTSTNRETRKEELSNILKHYHSELEDYLLQLGFPPHTYTFSQLVEDYQDAVVPAVGIAVNLIPGVIETGDETDSVGLGTGRTAGIMTEILEELVEMEKI
ncbi:uncharacterized protein LOC111695518 isoform X2 [Eurytemora carolleeae]|uniref:uncharacterized protein LOC111695518 isoform X2 n=1 Tax=Eurytemora carolleeae TaxID=1294199 RepID=UPI000C75F4BF|nr:uncharacterized protein LOC111695518 isoform X2 [Eurytemora carolleeae]|eukprot:XP_023320650.1 uncharacterized protein LOC111695518 isoform X2 [Eurytemora affinis]